MGVIIKYALNFKSAGFTVSNDLLKGDFIIDASVEAKMKRGAAGGTFKITLYDLPWDKAVELKENLKSKVLIELGYMDGEFGTIMEGIYTKVTARVERENLVTTIEGLESATYALKYTRTSKSLKGTVSLIDALAKLMKEAFSENALPSSPTDALAQAGALIGIGDTSGGDIDQEPKQENIQGEVQDIVMKDSLMSTLEELSRREDAEFLVCDKKVSLGKPLADTDYEPDEFDPDVNLGEFRLFSKDLPEEEGENLLEKLPPYKVLGFTFIVAGDPRLRPAQKVSAKVKDYRTNDGEFRIHSLVHSLSMNGGYICKGEAVKVCTDNNCLRQQDALGLDNPDAFLQKFSQRTKEQLRRNPVVEVGTVKQYSSGEDGNAPHRTTLYFGQRFAKTETQPSVRAEVKADDNQLLRNKPIVSPFAWHKCGLVVPVYPGMKALLSHNLNLTDDALVTGFLWSEKPTLDPPKSKEGDWWLCLPIDFDPSKPPTDNTKAVNDLIANNGKRVIELKGLKITVGTAKLGNVGVRPTPGNDDEFLVEHSSGAKITLNDQQIEITDGSVTNQNTVTINSTGVTVEDKAGNKITLDSGGVTIKSTSVKLGGVGATEPFVLGTKLTTALDTFFKMLVTHTHIGNLGAPTTPPMPPLVAPVLQTALSQQHKVDK